jgi:hypothetical protein
MYSCYDDDGCISDALKNQLWRGVVIFVIFVRHGKYRYGAEKGVEADYLVNLCLCTYETHADPKTANVSNTGRYSREVETEDRSMI